MPTPVAVVARAAALLLLVGAGVRADEQSDLEKAYGAFVAHRFDEAEGRLRALLDAGSGGLKKTDSVADARIYLAAVLISEGKKEEAAVLLETLLLDKPDYQPDPLRVPLAALDAIVDARLRLRDRLVAVQAEKVRLALEQKARLEAEKQRAMVRLATLERLASEEIIVERHSRWEALIPLGVGQFQNRQLTLGWSLLASESLLAAGSAIGFGLTLYNEGLAYDALRTRAGTAKQYEARAQEAALIGNIFAAGFAAVAIAGIAQAEFAFVPEYVNIEQRKGAPPRVSLAPVIGPGAIGFAGKF